MATTNATDTALAAEAEKKAQEALKLQQAQEKALLDAYTKNSQGIYDTAKTSSSDYLTGAKSDIESLYDKGYTDLQALTGQESEAAIKESLRPIEGKLANQGLLGGPSGALNEALAGASERVRNAALSKLEDYLSNKTSALSNVYSNTASQRANLEQTYGTQSQGLLSTALENALAGTNKGADVSNQYTMAGLEAALGTNKTILEQAGQTNLVDEQAKLNSEADAASNATKEAQLKTAQDNYDRQLYALQTSLYNQDTYHGPFVSPNDYLAQAVKQLGPRPR